MKVLFTCGGTAGHINPAIAVAQQLAAMEPQTEFLFVGAEGNMECDLIPREGYAFRSVRIRGFRRGVDPRSVARNLGTLHYLNESVRASRRIIRDFAPDAAVGTGGYVCFPVLTEAARLGVPTAVHESNALPGLTTRMLEGRIDEIMVGFEESRSYYHRPDKVRVTGTPVRAGFSPTDRDSARKALGIDPQERVVVAAFGSLGADYMNGVMSALLELLGSEPPFRLIYATGTRYYARVSQTLREKGIAGPRLDVREYIYDMPAVMTAADVVLCRGGASTISELTCIGKPAILIPSPNVVNHHQEKNASVLARAGAARMLLEGAFDAQDLLRELTELLDRPDERRAMSEASRAIGFTDAAERIAAEVLALARRGHDEK